MDAVNGWIKRIRQLAADKELAKDKKKRSSAYNDCYIKVHAFLESELQAGKFHPGLGIRMYVLAEPEHYWEARFSGENQQSAGTPKIRAAKTSAAHGKSTPSAKRPKNRLGTGSLHAEIPAPEGLFIAGLCLPDEYRLLWLVYRVRRGWVPFGESQQKSMRKQVSDLCDSYRRVLMPMPRLGALLRAIDRSDIDELRRLWPKVKKELVWAVAERPRAKDDRVGARLARVVGVTSQSLDSTPDVAAKRKGGGGRPKGSVANVNDAKIEKLWTKARDKNPKLTKESFFDNPPPGTDFGEMGYYTHIQLDCAIERVRTRRRGK